MLRSLLANAVLIVGTPLIAAGGMLCQIVRPGWEAIPRAGRLWSRLMLRAAGVDVRYEGLERLDGVPSGVLVANHASHLDVYLVAANTRIPYRFVAKKELFKIPIFGPAMRAGGFVSVERGATQKDVASLKALRSSFDGGAIVVFFPEGTRSRDGRMRRFKKGAFVVAIENGVPIVPVVIVGSGPVHPPGSWRFHRGKVEMRVLEPIPTDGMTLDDRNDLVDRVQSLFVEQLPPDQLPADTGR